MTPEEEARQRQSQASSQQTSQANNWAAAPAGGDTAQQAGYDAQNSVAASAAGPSQSGAQAGIDVVDAVGTGIGDAADWAKGAVGTVGGWVGDMFSAEQVSGPQGGSWGQAGTPAAGYNAGANARGGQIAGQAGLTAREITGQGYSAANRNAPNTRFTDQYRNLGDSARGVADAYNSAAASSTQQDRQLAALNNFANAGEGPSAAQAQLQAGSDAAQRSAMSMARSGRGAGESASALRDAAFRNAETQGTVAGQSAQLRAQETDAYKQRQLAALNAAMGGAGAIRAGDATAAQIAQGTRAQDMGFQSLMDSRSQFGTQTQLSQQQLNDAARLGLLQTGLGYQQLGQAGELGFAQLGQNALNSQADYELAQQQMRLDAAKANQSADLEKDGGFFGAIASGVGAMFSDERLKKDIKAERALSRALGKGGGELETLGNAPAYSYRYKDTSIPGTAPGVQRSSMAQDLEGGPHGDRVVNNTPQGKMVNYEEVVKLTPGALTELNQRLHALEKSLGKKSAA